MTLARWGFGLFIATLALLFIYSRPDAPRWAFDVDREEGVHGDVDAEWWYHYGWLTDEAGGEWAWVSSFFRALQKGRAASRYLLYDLIDLKTGEHRYRSRLGSEAMPLFTAFTGESRLPPPHDVIPGAPAEKPGDPLKLAYGEDSLERIPRPDSGRGGARTYRLKAGEIDVELHAASPAMAVEGTGLAGLRKPEDMRYYTIPRLEAIGTVRGRKAKGIFWYDHQWGGSWVGATIGWSWWGLQLDDGTSVNAYVVRDAKTGEILRSVLTRDHRVSPLEATPLEWWESATRVRYPVRWRLSGGGLRLEVEPAFTERECSILRLCPTMWEGPVRVTGTVTGRGFQELVGYGLERKGDKSR